MYIYLVLGEPRNNAAKYVASKIYSEANKVELNSLSPKMIFSENIRFAGLVRIVLRCPFCFSCSSSQQCEVNITG